MFGCVLAIFYFYGNREFGIRWLWDECTYQTLCKNLKLFPSVEILLFKNAYETCQPCVLHQAFLVLLLKLAIRFNASPAIKWIVAKDSSS
jgi:hypothetical protein